MRLHAANCLLRIVKPCLSTLCTCSTCEGATTRLGPEAPFSNPRGPPFDQPLALALAAALRHSGRAWQDALGGSKELLVLGLSAVTVQRASSEIAV